MSSLLDIKLFQKESLQNPVILAGIVVLALALAAVAGSASKLTGALLFKPEPSGLLLNRETQPTTSVSPDDITNRNFFGLASDKPTVAIETLPETELKLTLRGAFAAADENEAGAIIEDERKVAEHYSVGDELPGNATLSAIYADRVVLQRNGLLETLYFPTGDFSRSGVGSRVNSNAQANPAAASSANNSEAAERREAIRNRIKELRGRR